MSSKLLSDTAGRRKSRRIAASQQHPSNCTNTASGSPNLDETEVFLDSFIESTKRTLQGSLPSRNAYRKRSRESDTVTAQQGDLFSGERPPGDAIWEMRLCSLPSKFFTSDEARLLTKRTNRATSKRGYKSLPLDEALISDLSAYFENQVEPHITRSQCTTSYNLLKGTLGQVARYACAVRRLDPASFCQQNALINLSKDEQLFRAFLMGIQTRCAASTVACKATALLKWVIFSSTSLAKNGQNRHAASCEATANYLRTIASAEKRESRRVSRSLKNPLERLQTGKILLMEDFTRGQERAETFLRGIMASMQSEFEKNRAVSVAERDSAVHDLLSRKNGAILRKWAINFLNLVVLHGSGQRAQVYAELQVAPVGITSERCVVYGLSEVERTANITGYFYLRTTFEKRVRSNKMPFIRLPSSILDIFLMHKLYMRPAIFKRARTAETASVEHVLLLNTETARPLTSRQVSNSVSTFFETMDPELLDITPLVIRRSYASIMYHRYLKGEIFVEKSRAQFLDFLAERLNTSVEQLEDSYCMDENAGEMISRIFSSE